MRIISCSFWLVSFALIIILCSIFLDSCKDNEVNEAVIAEESASPAIKNMTSNHSFELSLNGWGTVTFVSCIPDPGPDANPLIDVSFYLIKSGELLYSFPYVSDNNLRETGLYENTSFVFVADSNRDSRDDVIIGAQYVSGAGPQGMIPYTEVRIYEDNGNSGFVYNETLSNEVNANLPAEAIVEYIKSFLANYQGDDHNES